MKQFNKQRTFKRQLKTHDEYFAKLFKAITNAYKGQVDITGGLINSSELNEAEIKSLLSKWAYYCKKAENNPKIIAIPKTDSLRTKYNDYVQQVKLSVYTDYVYKQCKSKYNMVSLDVDIIKDYFFKNVAPDLTVFEQFQHLLTSYQGLKNNPEAKVSKYIRYKVYFVHYMSDKWRKLLKIRFTKGKK